MPQVLNLRIILWSGRFYSLIQLLVADGASGEDATKEIVASLLEFGQLMAPAVVLAPTVTWIIRHFVWSWRLALMRAYTDHWEHHAAWIEGASQRTQEDTKNLAKGVFLVCSEILAAAFALAVVAPTLSTLGSRVQPPGLPPGTVPGSWLVLLAVLLASLGLLVASFVANNLVAIDMDNQRLEARYRKTLVNAEQETAGGDAELLAVEGDLHRKEAVPATSMNPKEAKAINDAHHGPPATPERSPSAVAAAVAPYFDQLQENYTRMYANLVPIDAWNATFMRLVVLLPYLLSAPRLFEAESGVTLGDVQMMRFLFGDVFFALNAIAQHWPQINELRATIRRLRELEVAMSENEANVSTPTVLV